MAYSKSYQEVTAGRVREDEVIGFFGDNKVALPPRVTSFNSVGGKKQPTVETDHLAHEGVGKTGTTSSNIGAYNPATQNVAT
jgi:hypothetical protein